MNVNDLYNGLTGFWNSISPILYFHLFILFFWIYVAGIRFNFRNRIGGYQTSERYKSTKSILEEFGLWTKLPIIMLFGLLLYLAAFNSVVDTLFSISIQPITISYSEGEFLEESPTSNEMIEIAKYSGDSSFLKKGHYFDVERLLDYKQRFLAEEKAKSPERYQSDVGWLNERNGTLNRYYQLSIIAFLVSLVIFIRVLRQRGGKHKFWRALRLLLSLLILFILVAIFRYRCEQIIEERIGAENYFVTSSLHSDDNYQTKKLDSEAVTDSLNRRFEELHHLYDTDPNRYKYRLFWISRFVEDYPVLEAILGKRNLHSNSYYSRKYEQSHRPFFTPSPSAGTESGY